MLRAAGGGGVPYPLFLAAGTAGAPSYTLQTAGTSTGWYAANANRWIFSAGGGARFELYSTGFAAGANALIGFTSGNDPSGGSFEVSFARKAAKVIELNAGAAGTYAGSAFNAGVQTVAQLPAAATAGANARSWVTDATQTFASANFGATVTGGGANGVPVVSDGTNWKIG